MISQPLDSLPSTDELPCSDDVPVDNEDQNLLPNLLLLALASLWSERMDWFFAVDMAVYHLTGVNPRVPVVPDAFLSLGVERRKNGKSRKSYATWEEGGTVPTMVLEMVSHRYSDEYEDKQDTYQRLGVLYYVVYNPEYWQRHQHQPFEVYKLVQGSYQLQVGEPYWMPEVGIGIGRGRQTIGGIEQEVLLWHSDRGQPYPLVEQALQDLQQQLQTERQRAETERQRAEQLAAQLRALGVDPEV